MNSSGVSAATSQDDGAYRQINVYSEVLRHIQTDYVVEPNIGNVTNGALKGLLESLDADSSYLTPEDYKAYKAGRTGKAQIGLNVSKRFGYATVVSVVPGGPADKANLSGRGRDRGDRAAGHAGSFAGDDPAAAGWAAGQPGDGAVVRPRKAAPEKVTMTRAMASVPPVSETMYENSSILYLKPLVLDHEHAQQIEAKLKGMQKAGNKKILLDLRNVAAGDMPEAVRVANFFLPVGDDCDA